LAGSRPILAQLVVQFPAAPDELWPFVADTNRFNRAVGLPAVDFVNAAGEDGESRVGQMRALGFTYARWIEHPFEWERPRQFAVKRDFLSGPLAHLRAGAQLSPVGSQTSVRFFAELTPRNTLFAPIIQHVVGPRQMARAREQFEALRAYLEHRSPSPFPSLRHAPTDHERRRVEDLSAQLAADDCPPDALEALCRHLIEGGDEDVSGMRPLELAQRWGTDPRATLETFLRGATAGLLEMRWELLCPSCRGVNAASIALHDLQHEGQCTACNLRFSATNDEAIEARFYPAAAVRAVNVGTYCVGGPMNTPHRDVQLVLGPGEERETSLVIPDSGWVMRSPQSGSVAHLVTDNEATNQTAEIRLSANLLMPDEVRVAPAR
jgi:hypothetical protein